MHVPADGRGQAAEVDGRQALLRQAVAQAAGQAPGTLAALGLGAVQGDLQQPENGNTRLIPPAAAGAARHGERAKRGKETNGRDPKPGETPPQYRDLFLSNALSRVTDCRRDFTGTN